MPTFIGHTAVALAINATIVYKKNRIKIILLSLLVAVIPDLDVIGYKYGIKYASLFGHRGFSHSLLFVLLVAFLIALIFFPKLKIKSKRFFILFLNFLAIGLSHIMLDSMTNGGLGVALFSPFSNARFFFPWRPIQVSSILPSYFYELNGTAVLSFEFLYFTLPALIYILIIYLYRKKGKSKIIKSISK